MVVIRSNNVEMVCSNSILYTGSRRTRVSAQRIEYDRAMTEISGCSNKTRTVIFPPGIRTLGQNAFLMASSLRQAILNEGLEVLGTDEYAHTEQLRFGTFSESGIEKIRLPSTLKVIEACAFYDCKKLKSIQLPEGLVKIEKKCFFGSGLESVSFPESLRTVCA